MYFYMWRLPALYSKTAYFQLLFFTISSRLHVEIHVCVLRFIYFFLFIVKFYCSISQLRTTPLGTLCNTFHSASNTSLHVVGGTSNETFRILNMRIHVHVMNTTDSMCVKLFLLVWSTSTHTTLTSQ